MERKWIRMGKGWGGTGKRGMRGRCILIILYEKESMFNKMVMIFTKKEILQSHSTWVRPGSWCLFNLNIDYFKIETTSLSPLSFLPPAFPSTLQPLKSLLALFLWLLLLHAYSYTHIHTRMHTHTECWWICFCYLCMCNYRADHTALDKQQGVYTW